MCQQETLKTAFKKNNVDYLEAKLASYKRTEIDTKTPLDQAFRDYLLDLLAKEVGVATLKSFVQLSIESCQKHLTSPTMPVVLLGMPIYLIFTAKLWVKPGLS